MGYSLEIYETGYVDISVPILPAIKDWTDWVISEKKIKKWSTYRHFISI